MTYPPQPGHYPGAGAPQPHGWYPPPAPYPPPRPRRRTGLIIGVVATVALLAAFGITGFVAPGFLLSDRDARQPMQASQPGTGESPAPAVPVERAADRDPATVSAALDALDPCKLLDVPKRLARTVKPVLTEPHSCELIDRSDKYSTVVRVEAGADFQHIDRFLAEPGELSGAKVYFSRISYGGELECELDVPVSFTRSIKYATEDEPGSGDPCKILREIAKTPVATLASKLTYRPDDVDTGEPGACVDFNSDTGCAPYMQVAVPEGGLAAIVEAAEKDPNVYCAAAAGAVGKHRKDMQPVTFSGQCHFVEPTHRIQVAVHIFRDAPAMGAGTEVCDDSAEIDLAGTASFVCANRQLSKQTVFLSLVADIQQPGALAVSATLLPPRGDLDADPKWEQAKLDVVQKIAEDIAREHA